MISLACVGDVMLGRGVNQVLPTIRPTEPWGDVLPLLQAADVRVANLECALTTHRQPWQRTPKVFHFRADPAAVAVLQAAGIDVCSLANNHILDFEVAGLRDTLQVLDRAGIRHAGAGQDLTSAMRPAILMPPRASEPSVAVAAITDNEPGWAATASRPGTHYLPVSTAPPIREQLAAITSRCRAAGGHLVVLSNHWGPNMVLRPSPAFRTFARTAVDAGVDLYYGHSAHVFQGIEVYRDRLILYDTGDFLDDYAVDPVLRNDWSCLVMATYEGRRLARLDVLPVVLTYARVRRATGTTRQAILDRVQALSAELGTRLCRHGDRLVWEHALTASA